MAFTKEFSEGDWEKVEGGYKIFIPLEDYNIAESKSEIFGFENDEYNETNNSKLAMAVVTEIGTTILSGNGPFQGKVVIS